MRTVCVRPCARLFLCFFAFRRAQSAPEGARVSIDDDDDDEFEGWEFVEDGEEVRGLRESARGRGGVDAACAEAVGGRGRQTMKRRRRW